MLTRHATLFDAAAAFPGARPVAGRGTAFVIKVGMPNPAAWLVRHYRRGGVVAPVLRDRYARWSKARAFQELDVSMAARSRGIPTPRVIAAVEYRGLLFKRFDIAVELVPDACDLAAALFGEVAQTAQASAEAAARVIRTFTAHGLIHADLNLKNILVRKDDAWVIDLDRCWLVPQASPAQRAAMRDRFMRSLAKWEKHTDRVTGDPLRRTLEQAFDV